MEYTMKEMIYNYSNKHKMLNTNPRRWVGREADGIGHKYLVILEIFHIEQEYLNQISKVLTFV